MSDDKDFLTKLGLSHCQIQANEFVHNGGWYDKTGHKLGYGDLSKEDIKNIARSLGDGEVFIVLGEQDSYWHFVTFIGGPASLGKVKTSTDEKNPGIDYVLEKCRYIIVCGQILVLVEREDKELTDYYQKHLGPQVRFIKRDEIKSTLEF